MHPRRTKIFIAALGLMSLALLPAAPALAVHGGFHNPLGDSSGSTEGGITSFEQLFDNIREFLQGFATPLVLLALVYGGIMLTFGGVDPGQVKRGKTIIFWSLIGLAVILMPLTIRNIVARDILRLPGYTGAASDRVLVVITSFIRLMLSVTGALALAAVIWGGLLIAGSFGDEGRARQGKTAATYGLIGLAVTILSFTLIELVVYIVGQP